MGLHAPLLTYFGEPKQTFSIKKAIEKEQAKIQVKGFIGSSFAIIASAVIRKSKQPQLFILKDKEEASYFVNDLENLLKNEIFFFPASYRRAYQIEKTDNANILLRAEVLNKLNNKRNPIIITYSQALSEKVVSRKELKKRTLQIKVGDKIVIDELEEMLKKRHFESVDFVVKAGQYSIRGGIFDIYSYADENPCRLEFFDTKIENIRTFNVNTQISINKEEKINIIPNTEAKKSVNNQVCFLDYIPKNTIIWTSNIFYTKEVLDDYFTKAKEQYAKIKKNNTIQYLEPDFLFTNGRSFIKNLNKYVVVENTKNTFFKSIESISAKTSHLTKINKQFDLLKEDLVKNNENGIQNIILCSSDEQEERFNAIFEHNKDLSYRCILFSLHEGFIDFTNKQAIYTDHQIFNRHHRFKSRTKFTDKQAITIKQLTQLDKGDFVTHIDHGIGRFEGLHKIEKNGKKQEVIKLSYKAGDLLYISIHSLHKISKFSGKEGVEPTINQLGSPAWAKTKLQTKTKVKKIAFNLIKLYAKRKHQKGFKFTPDTYLQYELESSFMFEDTPDQSKATADVKADMEKETPMDRLVCGDVGFGKTEIAIRAAFKAVADSKQTAVLVPTTILALQHYKTFKKRLKNLPCTIDYINRFKTKKQQKETLEKLARGEIDILIGTHRIVGKDVRFLDLGLLIIDEEQKFGVNIKDKLKLLKESIDTLTLSATPIPRTLQFSLLGARDLSIINTPPPNRQSVDTEIIGFNQETIRNAISYEMSRNGQVFFVHNRIENIKEVAGLLQMLCPDAKIKVGHGQMEGKKLEELMISFMEGEFDILVSTTIIENGLDVPNTNTIIINNALLLEIKDLVFINDTLNPEIYFWPDVGDVHVYNNLIVVGKNGEIIPTLIENNLNDLYISHNLFYDSSRVNLDSDLKNNALYEDPLLLNSLNLGENDPQAYQIQNNSPAIGSGFLINGSVDTINYLEHNGGLDYFGNSVSHHFPSNIGAFNGSGQMDILAIKLDDIRLSPSVTHDFASISIQDYEGSIQTKIYALNGDLMSIQIGNKLSFKKFSSGIYFCVVSYGSKNKNLKVVKL